MTAAEIEFAARNLPAKAGRSASFRGDGVAQSDAPVDDSGSGPPPVYTIGHSTRTIPEFVDLLKIAAVDLVVDIRSVPRSRTNPQYNLDVLPDELAPWQIGHTQIPELGGLRHKSKTVSHEVNAFWINQSFHNYADYALSSAFHVGLSRLLDLSQGRRCAIMCSEAVWWRCHRRIVADYLINTGRTAFHLMAPARIEPATLTKAAVAERDWLVYPADRNSSNASSVSAELHGRT